MRRKKKLNLGAPPRLGGRPVQQDQVHLPGVRAERLGQAGARDRLPAVRRCDARGDCGLPRRLG